MNIDKFIEALEERNILSNMQSKRLTTSELPARTYTGLIMASLATKKNIANCLSTAIETYLIRNREKHLEEIKLQAKAKGQSIEEYLAECISSRLPPSN